MAANAFCHKVKLHRSLQQTPTADGITINELAEKIVRLTGSESEIVHLPERDGDVKHSQAAVDKLQKAGFRPSFDFDAGLRSTIEYFSAPGKG